MIVEGPRHIRKVDKVLGEIIKKVGPMTIQIAQADSPFEALFESIVYQQLTGKAAASILKKVLALYPKKFLRPLV